MLHFSFTNNFLTLTQHAMVDEMFLAFSIMPLVGDTEFLHVSLVNRMFRDGYAACNMGSKVTAGVTIFSTLDQVREKVKNGYSKTRGMEQAVALGRVDVMQYFHGLGARCSANVWEEVCLSWAAAGNLGALRWSVESGMVCRHWLTSEVNHAAVANRHLGVFRFCIDTYRHSSYSDVEESVRIGVGDARHMEWVWANFSDYSDSIASGIAKSGARDAYQMFREVYDATEKHPRVHAFNLKRLSGCGNRDILDHVARKIGSSAQSSKA